MTWLIRLFFPGFEPAATVENAGARTIPVEGVRDDTELERVLTAVLDRTPDPPAWKQPPVGYIGVREPMRAMYEHIRYEGYGPLRARLMTLRWGWKFLR